METVKVRGSVKWFNDGKGYGFIAGGDGKEFFCHYSDILGDGRKSLQQHQEVEFVEDQNAKGPRARKITVV